MKLFILFISFFIFIKAETINTLNIVIEEDILKDYKKFVKNRDPLKIKNFEHKDSRRSTVEVVLLQQALYKGGYKAVFDFYLIPTYKRKLIQLKKGQGMSSATSIWLSDLENIKNDIYISDALIRNGEFEAGLYTIETNTEVLSSTTLEDIQKLTAISNKNWISDWQTLDKLHLKKLIHTVKWNSMTRMVAIKRADFLLAPFQSKHDLSFVKENIKFIPIKNIKVGLQGSRHFVISKNNPNSKKIFEALNKGIKILRKEGIIKKAYIQSGFFNEQVKNWKKLN